MKRYFIYLSYDGTNYCGWQLQPNAITVQQKIEDALSTLLRERIAITGAGRTDTGVHASLMVAHFNAEEIPDPAQLAFKLNSLLPRDIAIDRIIEVSPDAHARFSARARTYHYYTTTVKSPFNHRYAYRLYVDLDYEAMNRAALLLHEYLDFTSFSKLHTDVKTNICHIRHALWTDEGNSTWRFTITADRFLRNMVRAIVGTLIEVGRGRLSIDGFREIIEAKDRSRAGSSAPPYALFLHHIEYDDKAIIPE
jgi:tRNA pseudouridine38-40 synthase